MAPETTNAHDHDAATSLLRTNLVDTIAHHAHWGLRGIIAAVFIFHGMGKFPAAVGMADMLGFTVPMIYVLGSLEILVGVLVLAGGLGFDVATRIGAALIVPIMVGAIIMVHWPQWSFAPSATRPMGGMEFQVTLIVLALYMVLKGNGIGSLRKRTSSL